MAGPYHIKNNMVCQDSYYIKKINESITIAAVADGLGSEKFSDIGSKIAAKVAVEHCIKNYNRNLSDDEVKKMINNAFVSGYKSILEEAASAGEDEDEYDTTLSLVIFDKTKLYFGQSGDSGIVVLLDTGEYIKSEEQNDEYGNVYPLCSGPNVWQFGKAEGNVVSVMLMTDGVLKRICPKILKYDERNINVNVPFAESFLRRDETSDDAVDLFQTSLREFLEKYPEEKIDDDKTVIIIFNDDINAKYMDEYYYKAPDWDKLRKSSLDNLNQNDNDNSDLTESSECSESLTESLSVSTDELLDQDKSNDIDETSIPKNNDTDYYPEKENSSEVTCSKKKLHSHKNPKRNKLPHHGNSIVFDLIVLLIVLIFSLLAFFSNEWLTEHANASYITVILLCFLSNATVLLPAPSAIVVIEFSFILNPVITALCGGLGSALGEMMGYVAGFHGARAIKNNKFKTFIKKHKSKHPFILTFLTSIIPLPIFDIIGIAAGASKLNPFKFFATTICGKTLKFLMYAFIAYQLIPIISSLNL